VRKRERVETSGIRWACSSPDEESDEETFEIGTEEHEITTF